MCGRTTAACVCLVYGCLFEGGLPAAEAPVLLGFERWQQGVAERLKEPGLVRLYTFQNLDGETWSVPNLASPDGAPLVYDAAADARELGAAATMPEVVRGRWEEKRAVRLDGACLSGPPVDPGPDGFTIEAWLRLRGPGAHQPRKGSHGTLLSSSTGYYDGWRITVVQPPNQEPRMAFSMGVANPREEGVPSANVADVPADAWFHLAATWDRREMRLYINGRPRGVAAFRREAIASHLRPTFRIGFAGYGVGAFVADYDEVAVYSRSLSPDEILDHARPNRGLAASLMKQLVDADAAWSSPAKAPDATQLAAARRTYSRIIELPPCPEFPELENFRNMARLRLAECCCVASEFEDARTVLTAIIAADSGVPEHFRYRARRLLGDTFRQQRRYTEAGNAYADLQSVATGRHEHWRVEAIQRLADVEGLADGAPYVSMRERRILRISRPAVRLFVAPRGSDTADGTRERPFRTLERARQAVRELRRQGPLPEGGVAIILRGGVYPRTQTFALGADDSGRAVAPVVYRAAEGETVRLTGGCPLPAFVPLRDPDVTARLPEKARGKVLKCDLRAAGIEDFGELTARGFGKSQFKLAPLELFHKGQVMTPARWPNTGFVYVKGVPEDTTDEFRGSPASLDGRFYYYGDRPSRWLDEPEVWLHGYFANKFAANHARVKRIDPDQSLIKLEEPYPAYCVRADWPYYAYNLLCELDCPGEYYLDRERGVLYFWPPSAVVAGDAHASLLETPLLELKDASHVVFRNLILEVTRGDAISVSGGESCLFAGCVVRNTGAWAIRIANGHGHAVIGCDIHDTGEGGVDLRGGKRETLTSCGFVVENCHIHDLGRWVRTYTSGIKGKTVGARASHNLIHEVPHNAINFVWNDNVTEYNEVHDVVYEASEMGMYYIWAGADSLSNQGNILRYNFFHDVPQIIYPKPASSRAHSGGVGVHVDAVNGGMTFYGNVFQLIESSAIANCGGRDTLIENNLFSNCTTAISSGDRSALYPYFSVSDKGKKHRHMANVLARMPYQKPPWSVRYPHLVDILEEENPGLPVNNRMVRNANYLSRWRKRHGEAKKLGLWADNWTHGDPGFVDRKNRDLRLQPDSPVYGSIGFERIPFERIGLYNDALRASWPVEHPAGVRRHLGKGTPKKRAFIPTCRAYRRTSKITIDGALDDTEWKTAKKDRDIIVRQTVGGKVNPAPGTTCRILYDDTFLYVGVRSHIDPARKLVHNTQWGSSDSFEIVIEGQKGVNTAGWWVMEYPTGPRFFLIGNADNQFDSLDAAGIPPFAAQRLRSACQYASCVVDATVWTAEWRIPFAELCIDPKNLDRCPLNLGSCKPWAKDRWLCWVGTGSQTYKLERAGELIFVK